MTGYILYEAPQNIDGQVTSFTSTGEQNFPDDPANNALDYATYTRSGSTANAQGDVRWFYETDREVPINAVGFAGHDFPEGSRVWLMDDSGPATVEELAPTVGVGPYVGLLSQTVSLDQFSVRVRPAGATQDQPYFLSTLFVGVALAMPTGFTSPFIRPVDGREATLYPSVSSKGGEFLGSHVERVGLKFNIPQQHVAPAWIEGAWGPLVRHIEHRPFFYAWDLQDHPGDTVYAWTDGPIRPPRYTSPIHQAFDIQCRGLHVI